MSLVEVHTDLAQFLADLPELLLDLGRHIDASQIRVHQTAQHRRAGEFVALDFGVESLLGGGAEPHRYWTAGAVVVVETEGERGS